MYYVGATVSNIIFVYLFIVFSLVDHALIKTNFLFKYYEHFV